VNVDECVVATRRPVVVQNAAESARLYQYLVASPPDSRALRTGELDPLPLWAGDHSYMSADAKWQYRVCRWRVTPSGPQQRRLVRRKVPEQETQRGGPALLVTPGAQHLDGDLVDGSR